MLFKLHPTCYIISLQSSVDLISVDRGSVVIYKSFPIPTWSAGNVPSSIIFMSYPSVPSVLDLKKGRAISRAIKWPLQCVHLDFILRNLLLNLLSRSSKGGWSWTKEGRSHRIPFVLPNRSLCVSLYCSRSSPALDSRPILERIDSRIASDRLLNNSTRWVNGMNYEKWANRAQI